MSKSCSESSSTCIHCLCESESPGEVIYAGLSEPLPHADVIRTIISCADQFLVLIFHCGHSFICLFTIII